MAEDEEDTWSSEEDSVNQLPQIHDVEIPCQPPEDWEIEFRIYPGRRQYSRLYQVIDKHGNKFAMKEIYPNRYGNGSEKLGHFGHRRFTANAITYAYKARIIEEVKILSTFRHERIVKYLGYDNGKEDERTLCIFYEYLNRGSLLKQMKCSQEPLDERTARKYTLHILEGLQFLHGQHVIHRDLKCESVLVDENHNAKLTDYGLSQEVIGEVDDLRTMVAGCSPNWMCPEVLIGGKFSRRSDVWSLGCTVIEMLTMKPPWGMYKPGETMRRITRQSTNPETVIPLPPGAQKFIKLIFQEKENRASVKQLLNHQWLT